MHAICCYPHYGLTSYEYDNDIDANGNEAFTVSGEGERRRGKEGKGGRRRGKEGKGGRRRGRERQCREGQGIKALRGCYGLASG